MEACSCKQLSFGTVSDILEHGTCYDQFIDNVCSSFDTSTLRMVYQIKITILRSFKSLTVEMVNQSDIG